MPSPEIVELLRPEWLRTAAHESGHAVAAAVQGITVEGARVWYEGHGQRTIVRGVMHPGRVRRGGPSGVHLADAELVMALAGPAAEVMWRRRAERVGTGTAERATQVMSAGDLRNARVALRGSALSLGEGRAMAHQLVRAHWSGIEQVARQLARRGYLSGSSVRAR